MAKDDRKSAEQRRIDNNRNKRLLSRREWEKLLDLAEGLDFRGSVSLKLHASNGFLGKIEIQPHQFIDDKT